MLELKYKKGLSGIIATILMIGLAVAIAGVVWVVVSNLVSNQLDEAGTCLDVIGKIQIDKPHTCYNSTSGNLHFSIVLGNIELDSLSVSISGKGLTKSYEITNTANGDLPLTFYNGSSEVYLPEKGNGFVYKVNCTEQEIGVPDSIKIFPTVNGQRCSETDSVLQIKSCSF